jgi:nitrite reductase (NADH) small subunit
MSATSQIANLGSIQKIPPGQGRCYIVGGEEIAVFRQRDGRLFATQNRCPHRQGPLSEGVSGAGKVVCPLHGHKFDLATGQGAEPGECLKVYRVSESDGDVILQEW